MTIENRFVGLGRGIYLYHDQATTRKFRQVITVGELGLSHR
jgi:hypothetical protein